MGITKTEGITLQAIAFQENSRIFKVFSKELGVISFIAKQLTIKKPMFLALTTPFCHGEFVFKKSSKEILKLEEGSVIDAHVKLREDLNSLLGASHMTEAMVKISYEDQESSTLFLLLERYLKALEKYPEAVFSLVSSFYLKLLLWEGILHLSRNCNLCKQPAIAIASGESLCQDHFLKGTEISFHQDELEMLFKLMNAKTFLEIQNLVITEEFFEDKILKLFLSLT